MRIALLAVAVVSTALSQTVIVEWYGTDIPEGYSITRKMYDEFHTVAPDRECLAQNNFYGDLNRVPESIVSYSATVTRYVHYFSTDEGAPIYHVDGKIGGAWVTPVRELQFYIGQDGTLGTPNPQMRGNDSGYGPNRIWIPNFPMEGGGEGNCWAHEGDEVCEYSWWTVMSWPKRIFLNGADTAANVRFTSESTMMMRMPTDENRTSTQDTYMHFMVRNGAQYYFSEHVFELNTSPEGEVVTDFNNNDTQGKRWYPWYPTPTSFDYPDPLPTPVAVDFTNVTEVGIYFMVRKDGMESSRVQLDGMKFTGQLSDAVPATARTDIVCGHRTHEERPALFSMDGRRLPEARSLSSGIAILHSRTGPRVVTFTR